jgi:RNA polymerase sigma-70 factor (ECF subfamily)
MHGTTVTIGLPDQRLLDLVRQGDDEAFGDLIRRYRQRCVDLAILMLRNRGDAEDEVQNAISKAYAHLDQYAGGSFPAWLARIVQNQCLTLIRARRGARFVYLDQTPDGWDVPAVELSARGPDPEGDLAFRQIKRVLRIEMRRVPRLLRDTMLLRDIEGLPMADVAHRLGITVPAAKSRLRRARTELRSRLIRHGLGSASLSPQSRSANPVSRVAHHRALHPLALSA